jgi:hypothetical protein
VENIGSTSDPKMVALSQELKNLNVPENYYSLGHLRDERTCLLEMDGRWLVFYSERGRMEDLHSFREFDDARRYLISVLADNN